MLEEADVVDADHHRHGTGDRRGVLDVQEARSVLPDLLRQIETEAEEGVTGNEAGLDARGNVRASLLIRDVSDELGIGRLRAKCVQQAPNVNLVAGEVAADGMSINGKAHEPYQY